MVVVITVIHVVVVIAVVVVVVLTVVIVVVVIVVDLVRTRETTLSDKKSFSKKKSRDFCTTVKLDPGLALTPTEKTLKKKKAMN